MFAGWWNKAWGSSTSCPHGCGPIKRRDNPDNRRAHFRAVSVPIQTIGNIVDDVTLRQSEVL